MRTLLASLALMLVFLAVAGLAFLYSGLYDVAATAPDCSSFAGVRGAGASRFGNRRTTIRSCQRRPMTR